MSKLVDMSLLELNEEVFFGTADVFVQIVRDGEVKEYKLVSCTPTQYWHGDYTLTFSPWDDENAPCDVSRWHS